MYELAIFDFDGTLVDSAPGIVDVMYQVCDHYGFDSTVAEHWKQLIGVPLDEQAEIILPGEGHTFHKEVADKYRDFYNSQAVELCPPFPELGSMLESLKEASITVTIASSKREKIIHPVLEHHDLSHYFSLVIGFDGVKNHKPHPEAVLNTLAYHDIPKDRAVVVGDSKYDLEMAKNAGVDAIGVTTGVHTSELLRQSSPIKILGSLSEVLEVILNGHDKAA